MACRISSTPVFSLALTGIGWLPKVSFIRMARDAVFFRISALLMSRMVGMFFALSCSSQWSSSVKSGSPVSSAEPPPAQSRRAISVFSTAFHVRSIRLFPNSPSSSNPGVSMNRQGPIPWISIAFCTGSVVVPGVSVSALIREDFPLLRFPKRAMWSRLALGVWTKFINQAIVVTLIIRMETWQGHIAP